MKRSRILGTRSVRSAGRSSGSIEITLPVCLVDLQGVSCRVELHDGLAPEVVLRPDVGFLLPVFDAAWELMSQALKTVGEIGEFWEGDYVLGFFPEAGLSGRPGLAYADALVVQRDLRPGTHLGTDERDRALEAFGRMIESMAAVAGVRLGLSSESAPLFGSQLAYAATGATIGAVDAFTRGLLLDVSADAGWCRENPWAEEHWLAAQTGLQNLHDRCMAWDKEPDLVAKQRQLWYQARRLETRAQPAQP